MEGKRSSSQRSDLLRKIREFTRSILDDLSIGKSPVVLIDRFRNYCTDNTGNCCCSSDLSKGKEILTLQRECHARRLDVLLRVLLIVQQLLQENRHGSKRDIYYMHPSVFSDQSVVDRAINDICILLQCSRHNLNVVGVAISFFITTFGGWLSHFDLFITMVVITCMCPLEKGRYLLHVCVLVGECNMPFLAYPVPVHVEEVKDIVSVAQYILVVEKESGKRISRYPYKKVMTLPSFPIRKGDYMFLRLLVEKLHLHVYCLVDCDPYGFDILTTYRFGSMQMAYDAKFLRVPEIEWLGAFPSDSEKYGLPEPCLLPLTAEDKRKTEAILHRCYLQQELLHWRLELELMLQRGVKFEIEALSVHSLSFLSENYIPSKIQVAEAV
ncbi:Meiotic recombination protein SPO11-1 [Vitis vinifera]|uniref:DNA topoisomerase (ATP-hydrolyzing) n=1 Tax=Vitis vinifera TaxID=29760 RepID=A0A438K104_VITVI|nr:Meiotic recombination protein SPO11-1 [Vitis vinifera]